MKVLVFGYLGGRNFGDELMLLGLIAGLRSRGVTGIAVITPSGNVKPYLDAGVERAFPRSIVGLVSGIAWADGLVICGGSMLHDAYPDDRHRSYRKNLLFIALLCGMTRLKGGFLELLGVGIGPISRPGTRLATKFIVRLSRLVVTRDRRSYEELAALGLLRAEIQQGQDLALRADLHVQRTRPSNETLLVSLVPTNLISTVGQAEAEEAVTALSKYLHKWLSEEPTRRLILPAVNVAGRDSDVEVQKQTVRGWSSDLLARVQTPTFDGDAIAFCTLIAGASAIISMRLHVAICAELLDVPCIWVPYQRKLLDMAAALEVPAERVIIPSRDLRERLDRQLTEFQSASIIMR